MLWGILTNTYVFFIMWISQVKNTKLKIRWKWIINWYTEIYSFGELIYKVENIITLWLKYIFLLWTFIFNLLISMLITLWLNSLSEGNKIWSVVHCAYYFLLQELQIWHVLVSFVYYLPSVSILSWLFWKEKHQENILL